MSTEVIVFKREMSFSQISGLWLTIRMFTETLFSLIPTGLCKEANAIRVTSALDLERGMSGKLK